MYKKRIRGVKEERPINLNLHVAHLSADRDSVQVYGRLIITPVDDTVDLISSFHQILSK
jgi:hypothetical protein